MRIALRSFALAAVAALIVAGAAGASGPAHSSGRACGLIGRIDGRLYDVRETKGNVPCRRVRTVATRFLRSGAIRPARGWVCFRGHGGVPWAASCARGSRVLVRVYPPT